MTSDELMELNNTTGDQFIRKIIDELITRSDLHTAAIVGDTAKSFDEAIEAIRAHVAPPKKKYTVEDIKRGISDVDWHYIYCGEYGYSTSGWCKQRPDGSCFKKEVADVIYAGLRATNNLPEEYR